MAKQTINIGTTANDGTGNTLRAAMDICNDNFTELYNYVLTKIDTSGTYTIAAINAATGLTPGTASGYLFLEENTQVIIISDGINWITFPAGTVISS